MGQLKHRISFYALSISAYISPMLMILSLSTNHWLTSIEKTGGRDRPTPSSSTRLITTTTTTTTTTSTTKSSTTTGANPTNSAAMNVTNAHHHHHTFTDKKNIYTVTGSFNNNKSFALGDGTSTPSFNLYIALDYIEATYGLWEMCRITGL